jgi:RecA-family ATPase
MEADFAAADRAAQDRRARAFAEAERGHPATWPAALDLLELAEREPAAPRHIIESWLPEGEVALLSGHGGAGKSQIALHTGVCIALGRAWYGGLSCAERRVLFLSAEDNATVLHWRIQRVCAHLGIDMRSLAGKLDVIAADGIDGELMTEAYGSAFYTPMLDALAERIRQTAARVAILDGASDLYGANEIKRRDVRRFIRALRHLVPADGAVLLLGHADKAAVRANGGSDRYSGSTAWHNSVRARWSLDAETEGDALALTLAKANHAAAGAQIRLRWDAVAHLHVADDAPLGGGIVGEIRDRQDREAIVAAMRACAAAGVTVPSASTGQRTAYHVLAARPELAEALRRDSREARRRVWRGLERLRAEGHVRETYARGSHRHRIAVLVLGAASSGESSQVRGMRGCGE